MESLQSLSTVTIKSIETERELKKFALHGWLMSQPHEVLVESLLRGVLSPHTLETIIKKARKEYDDEHDFGPKYKNLQVNGSVDGVKIGSLRVFTTDGRRAGKVIGFEPAPLPATPRVSPRLQKESGAGSTSNPASGGDGRPSPATQVQGSKKAQGKRTAVKAVARASPCATPGAFVVQWSSKPASARNTYDGATERLDLESLAQLTWHRVPHAPKGNEGDWTNGIFNGFLDEVHRRSQEEEDDARLWLWLQLTPPLLAAFEQMVRAASVRLANTSAPWDRRHQPPGELTFLPATNEIEISMAGMRTVVPAPELMYTCKLKPMRPPSAGEPVQPVLSFSCEGMLSRSHHTVIASTAVKAAGQSSGSPGRVGSFLHVRGPRLYASPPILGMERLSNSAYMTLTHLYQPAAPLLRFYVWALQRRGLTVDLVQNVVRYLLMRKEDQMDCQYKRDHTDVTRKPPRPSAKPAIVIALTPSHLSTLKQYADLLSAENGFAASHRAELLTVAVSTDSRGEPSLLVGLRGHSELTPNDKWERRRVTKASLLLRPPSDSFTASSLKWPETVEFRSFRATFDVSDGSATHDARPASSLVDVLINAPPRMRAELHVCPPVVTHDERDDGGLSLWLTLPKGGHVSVDAPCISWQTNPQWVDVLRH